MATGDIRAIRLFGTQKVQTDASSAAALKSGPLTVRIVSRQLEFDRKGHRYFALQSASDPYKTRLMIGQNLSPWAIAQFRSSEGGGTHDIQVTDRECDSLGYTEWVLVYTPAVGATDGSLAIYRDGAPVSITSNTSPVADAVSGNTMAIPASDTGTWSGDLRLVIGGMPPDSAVEQASQHCEIALWSAALTSDEVLALYHTPLYGHTAPQAASLLWYSRASKVLAGGLIVPDGGSLSTLNATMDAGVSLVADVPS